MGVFMIRNAVLSREGDACRDGPWRLGRAVVSFIETVKVLKSNLLRLYVYYRTTQWLVAVFLERNRGDYCV